MKTNDLKSRLNLNGRIFDLENLTNEKEFKKELRLFLFKVLSKKLEKTSEIIQGVKDGLNSKLQDLDYHFNEFGCYIDKVKNEMKRYTTFTNQAIDILYNHLYKMNLKNTIKSDLDFSNDSFIDDLELCFCDNIVNDNIEYEKNDFDYLLDNLFFMNSEEKLIGLYLDKSDKRHYIIFNG